MLEFLGVIAGLVLLLLAVLWLWDHRNVSSSGDPPDEDDPTRTYGEDEEPLPDIKWSVYLERDGIYTLRDLRAVHSLSDEVKGLGESRARDVLNGLAHHFEIEAESRSTDGITAIKIEDGPNVHV